MSDDTNTEESSPYHASLAADILVDHTSDVDAQIRRDFGLDEEVQRSMMPPERPFQKWEDSDAQLQGMMAQFEAANPNELLQRLLKMSSGYEQRQLARSGLTTAVEEVITEAIIHEKIFNTQKTDYGQNPSMFLGQDAGLFDTINRKFPETWQLYKEQKSLDWSEDEFGFDKAQVAFLTVDEAITDRMLHTLGWQWEGDSTAARSILAVMGNFISNAELQAAWTRITDNENLHAATYSEIVRLGIPDPERVFKRVLENAEAMRRLSAVGRVMHAAYERSHQYALGLVPNDQETYNHAMMFTIALLLLERIQFAASFAITFAIGQIPEAQAFMPIINAVRRIAQDELEVHVTLDKLVIANELKTERGQVFMATMWEEVTKLIREVTQSELDWAHWMLVDDPRPLASADGSHHLTYEDLCDWIYLAAQDVYSQFGFPSEFPVPEKVRILNWITEYLDVSKVQFSPQEQLAAQYKTNLKVRDDVGVIYDPGF